MTLNECPHCHKSLDVCFRCGEPLDGSWEDHWPNFGYIRLGLAAQAFAYLGGAKIIAGDEHFAWWKEGHPAMTINEAQQVAFKWGDGFKYENPSGYKMCSRCQRELLRTIGRFFGIDQRVRQLKDEAADE